MKCPRPDPTLVRTLGKSLLGLIEKGTDRLRPIRGQQQFWRLAEARAVELGVSHMDIHEAARAFEDHMLAVNSLPKIRRIMVRRGYDSKVAREIFYEHASAKACPQAVAARAFHFHVMERPLSQRLEARYQQRYAALYPGKRKANRNTSMTPFDVTVSFADHKSMANGYGEARRKVIHEEGRQSIHWYYQCSLRVSRDCGLSIFAKGILGSSSALTVWADELSSPALPDGMRAFDAVWVGKGRGYGVSTHEGILLKTARGALEHYPKMTLDEALERRDRHKRTQNEKRVERNARLRVFKPVIPRRTLQEQLALQRDKSSASSEETQFGLAF